MQLMEALLLIYCIVACMGMFIILPDSQSKHGFMFNLLWCILWPLALIGLALKTFSSFWAGLPDDTLKSMYEEEDS